MQISTKGALTDESNTPYICLLKVLQISKDKNILLFYET